MKSLLLSVAVTTAVCSSFAAGAQSRKYLINAGLQATVNHAPGSKTVQVLIPGVETIELELSQPASNTFQIKTVDYNFDGNKDFAFMSVNQTTNVQTFDIFLYHPADKTFELLEMPEGASCSAFSNVRLNPNDKTLHSSCRVGAKGSQDIFKWTDPFTLTLTKTTNNSPEAQAGNAEEKADEKAEKAEQREEKRNERKEKKETPEDDN